MDQKKIRKSLFGSHLGTSIIDLEVRRNHLFYWLNVIICFASIIMLVFLDEQKMLLSIAVICCSYVNLILIKCKPKWNRLLSCLFFVETMLFSAFVLLNPNQFGFLWIVLIPLFSFYIFGRKGGLVMFIGVLLIIIIFFYTNIRLDEPFYNDAICIRFMIVYIVIGIISFFIESIRFSLFKQMEKTKEEAKKYAQFDPLTGIYNRYRFYEILDEKIAQTEQKGILMIDIDYFKIVNDTYGHLIGDCILKEIANILKECIEDDIFCRWGGEEFVVFVKHIEKASFLAEKIRSSIENKEMKINENVNIHVTASIGLVTCSQPSLKMDSLLQFADECLYQAKKSGKNRVVEKIIQ